MRHAASAAAGVTGAVLLGLGLFGQPAAYVAAFRTEWAVLMDRPVAARPEMPVTGRQATTPAAVARPATDPTGSLTGRPPGGVNLNLPEPSAAPGSEKPKLALSAGTPGEQALPPVSAEQPLGSDAGTLPASGDVGVLPIADGARPGRVLAHREPTLRAAPMAAVLSAPADAHLPEATQPYLAPTPMIATEPAGAAPATASAAPKRRTVAPRAPQRLDAVSARMPATEGGRAEKMADARQARQPEPQPVRQTVIPPQRGVTTKQPAAATWIAPTAVLAKLRAAQWALDHGAVEQAQRLLEEAQLRLVLHTVDGGGDGDGAARSRGAALIAQALSALGGGRNAAGRRAIAGASGVLSGAATNGPTIATTGTDTGGYAPAYPPH